MYSKKIKVLIVDDTVVYRKIVSDILTEIPEVQVVGTANNGKIAISRIQILKPDLLILDVEMPEVDGIGVLEHIREKSLGVKAVMLSSFTQDGSEKTIKALELGAFDFIPKPETASMDQSRQEVRQSLISVIKAFVRQAELSNILKGKKTAPAEKPSPLPPPDPPVQRQPGLWFRKPARRQSIPVRLLSAGKARTWE